MKARLTLLSLGISALAASAVQATELCVKCTGPDAAYSCVVGSGHSNATIDTVAKFYCITTLAKKGSHASCAIDRTVTAPCPGERRELPIPAILNGNDGDGEGDQTKDASPAPTQHQAAQEQQDHPGPAAAIAPPPAAEPPASEPPPAQAASEPPPKTVQEMVEKSAQSAGNGLNETQKSAGAAAKSASTALEKAGSAVGGVAKSSWQCLSSFFSKC